MSGDKIERIFDSARASVGFALSCLEPVGKNLRAKSSFVDPQGEIMHWHEFGDLEGPGWAANTVGGAHLLYRWGTFLSDEAIRSSALRLLDHVLEDGFIQPDGFIWPYYELAKNHFCLNYTHNDDWLCPGSLAKIGVQMLEFTADLEDTLRASKLRQAAGNLSGWLASHVPRLPSGWVPRRITRDGEAYPLSPHGSTDSIYDHSADGLYLLQLWALTGRHELALSLGDAFIAEGGLWGSINHDTFDDHENVAYAVAFRVLRQACVILGKPAWQNFAWKFALPAMLRFRMAEDRNSVATRGLFLMEDSWDTAYLWENAEVAQAYLEAWQETTAENTPSAKKTVGDETHLDIALGVLEAIACHHYGSLGFLTEGVDWNNHVGQQHHMNNALYGAIQYTEPLLNNLHLLLPTLTYFQASRFTPWFHGTPLELAILRAGSTITQYHRLAEVFSHKPTIVSAEDDGSIRHNGVAEGYIYLVTEQLQPGDVIPHPRTTMAPGWEWLTRRDLPLTKLGSVSLSPGEFFSPELDE
jgi:hypothetical protein